MTLFIILTSFILLCLILLIIAIILDFHTLGKLAAKGILISFVFFIVVRIVINIMTPNNEPTALDVYRGKTTLEITYRDSVAVDSVVVYKVK